MYNLFSVPVLLFSDWLSSGFNDNPEVRGLPKMCEEGRLNVGPASEKTCEKGKKMKEEQNEKRNHFVLRTVSLLSCFSKSPS